MFDIRVDQKKNRLYIKLGLIETGEGEMLFNEIKSQLTLLSPGFSGVSDITGFKVNDPDEGVWAEKIFSLLIESEIGISARITGAKGETKEVVGDHGGSVFIVETLEKADQLLDSL